MDSKYSVSSLPYWWWVWRFFVVQNQMTIWNTKNGGKNMGYSINSSLNISKPQSSGAVFIWSKRILIGGDLKCSRNKPTPRWISSKWFRYGFLIFFLTMFGNMVFQTYLVGAGASSLREAIKLFWTFRVPWGWTYTAGTVADWVAQFSFGFYSLMLTSLLLGLIVMVLYKPRTWCAFCPMGTMTQGICKLKNNGK